MFKRLFSMQLKLMVTKCQAPKMTKSTMKEVHIIYNYTLDLKSSISFV